MDACWVMGLSIAAPVGWSIRESLTVIAPDAGLANVTLSSAPLETPIDVEQFAAMQGELGRGAFQGYEEDSFNVTTCGLPGRCFLRQFRWTPPHTDWVPVTQLQQYAVAAMRGYTATATALSTEFEGLESQLRAILGSCAVESQAPVQTQRSPLPRASSHKTWRSQLKLGVPTGWLIKESLSLQAPDGQGNLNYYSEPLDHSVDAEEFVRAQGDRMRTELPHYVESALGRAVLPGNREGRLRWFQWVPPDGVPVTQLQQYEVGPGRGYIATATSPTGTFHAFEADFRAVLSSCGTGQLDR